MTGPLSRRTGPAVVAAFPATGKTWATHHSLRYIDSDSTEYRWVSLGVGNRAWPDNYMGHIEAYRRNPTMEAVFVSTHAEVRTALAERGIPFTLVFPIPSLREEYRQRMMDRGSPPNLIARVIDDLWDSAIADCAKQRGCKHIVLGPGQFLADVIEEAVQDAA